MNWRRLSREAIQCGEWIISRTRHGGEEMYSLWRGSVRVATCKTADEAKAAAEEATE